MCSSDLDPISADPILTGPILAGWSIVSPAFARLRFVGPIFGSHVSKDYSRKSHFDKSSKHFFREIFSAPVVPSGVVGCRIKRSGAVSRVRGRVPGSGLRPGPGWASRSGRTQGTPAPSAS